MKDNSKIAKVSFLEERKAFAFERHCLKCEGTFLLVDVFISIRIILLDMLSIKTHFGRPKLLGKGQPRPTNVHCVSG